MFPGGRQTLADQMKLMAQLLQRLSQRDTAAIFNHPVMASEYPDYHQIVTTPMDLGTIQGRIRQEEYQSLEACAKDVRVVWTNAYLYNPAGSVVAQSARSLSKVFEGMYNKINPSDFNYAREPNVEERHKFSRDIYRVEDSNLAEAVGLLEQRCPEAVLRDNEEGYFVVKVDALPPPVFWEVELYLRRHLSTQPDRTKKKIPTTFRPVPEAITRLTGRKRTSSSSSSSSDSGERNADASNAATNNNKKARSDGHGGEGSAPGTPSTAASGKIAKKLDSNHAAFANGRTGSSGNKTASAAASKEGIASWQGAWEAGREGTGLWAVGSALVEGVDANKGAAVMPEADGIEHPGWAETPADTSYRERGMAAVNGSRC